jgi:hypothetical protein
MNLIIALFFRTPFWVQFAAAACLIWFGFTVQQQDWALAAARAELLKQTPPATIAVTAFSTDAPREVPVELSVSALVALDHNTRLVRKTNGVTTGEDLLYVLVDPAKDADITVAQAAIVIDPDDLDAFAGWLTANTTDFTATGPIATISGLRADQSNSSHAYRALNDQGMTPAPGFFFIEPFFAGRDVTLAALPAKDVQIVWIIYGFAGLMALIGLRKLRADSSRSLAKSKPGSAIPVRADAVPAGRGMGAYSLAEMQAGQMMPPAKPAKQPKTPMSKARTLMFIVCAALLLGLITGQAWVYTFLPMVFFGLLYLGIRSGLRSVTQQVTAVIETIGAKSGIGGVSPSVGIPAAASAPRFTPFAPAPAAKDNGPIRSGFSFKDLLPQQKHKAPTGPDPFERLAQQRQRQDGGSAGR